MTQEEKNRYVEFSLANLSKRKDFRLASPMTRNFSTERTGIMGTAPKNTKLIAYDYDKAEDSITFYFMTEATEKYGPNYQYKDVNPNRNFALERNPSKLYEIWLKLLNVSQLQSLSQSRVQKKKFDPNIKTQSNIPASKISLEEVKAWIWDTDFKLFSNSPSFHWQGFNKKLSQVNASIFPWNEDDTGYWDSKHGEGIIDKHLLDLFIHIKFFVNQMAGTLLRHIRKPQTPHKPMPKPQPITPQGSPKGTPPVTPDAPISSTPIQKARVQAIQKQPIANQIMANNDINSPINQEIDKSNDYQGNQNENPANINKEDEVMPESWSMSGYGPKLTQIVENKEYQTYFNTKVEHLQNRIIELDSKYKDYEFEFNSHLNLDERTSIFNKLTGMKEVTIQFESGEEEARYKGLIRETLKFIKDNDYDVITFESTLKNYEHAHLTKVLAEVINLAFPQYKEIVGNSNNNSDFVISLIKEKIKHLTEIDEFPGRGEGQPKSNDEQGNNETQDKPTGKTNIDNPKSELPPKPTKDANIQEGKKLVCAFGSFNPPTKLHLELLKSVLATAKMKKADTVVFLQRNAGYANDSNSVKQRGMIITKLSSIHCITDNIITDFNSAMDWAYNKRYTSVMVIAGSDQVSEMSALIKSNNNKDTNQGHFKFEDYKVGSYGDNNPDESKDSKLAVNAALDGNESEFIRILDFSDVKMAKKLYVLAVNQLKAKAGLTESRLKEIQIKALLALYRNNDERVNDTRMVGRITLPDSGKDQYPTYEEVRDWLAMPPRSIQIDTDPAFADLKQAVIAGTYEASHDVQMQTADNEFNKRVSRAPVRGDDRYEKNIKSKLPPTKYSQYLKPKANSKPISDFGQGSLS